MGVYKVSGAVTGATISADSIMIKSVLISSSSGNASATIKGDGITEIHMHCAGNDTKVYPAVSGGNQFSLEPIKGPVTIDVTGAGAFVRVSY